MNNPVLALVSVMTLSLMACGESDLETVHDEQLLDAISLTRTPELLRANPELELVPTTVGLQNYSLIFSDEFNDVVPDVGKWSTQLWSSDTVVYDQLQYYVNTFGGDPVLASDTDIKTLSFNGEHLLINAHMAPDNLRAQVGERPWLSGLIHTRDRFSFTYGYVEARVKVDAGRGVWPAFWMLGATDQGVNPELYIFEYDGGRPDAVFHNYLYQDDEGTRSSGQQQVSVPAFADRFHTVGVRWRPEELVFFIDGLPSFRVVGEQVPDQAMYLIFNLAMGGVWTGAPDATTPEKVTMTVDYVRVYQEGMTP